MSSWSVDRSKNEAAKRDRNLSSVEVTHNDLHFGLAIASLFLAVILAIIGGWPLVSLKTEFQYAALAVAVLIIISVGVLVVIEGNEE